MCKLFYLKKLRNKFALIGLAKGNRSKARGQGKEFKYKQSKKAR